MAFYPKLEGPALESYRAMAAELKRRLMESEGLSDKEVVVRPLRADDIGPTVAGSTQDYYYGQTALGWDSVINGNTIEDNRFVGINGVFLGGTIANGPSPVVAQIRVTREGALARYWFVQNIMNFEEKTGYTDEPVIVDQNTVLTIENYGRTASSMSNWGFVGAVAEKRGILINP